uniref:Cysteine protease n=1 Tax=Trypanosoma congolense (strain IL3000) TaxID=1068625 RepID=G0V387_TRYCI|nr:unnamed protein product [Trypanosoma congolense IL3000]
MLCFLTVTATLHRCVSRFHPCMKGNDDDAGNTLDNSQMGFSCGAMKCFLYNVARTVSRWGQDVGDDDDVHLICLGKYHGKATANVVRAAAQKLLYFSYRRQFEPLRNGATSDVGWGCTIRACQMMLAWAFMRYRNGGSVTMDDNVVDSLKEFTQRLFYDVPTAPFGIHAMTNEGVRHGVTCGMWFGPTPMAKVIGALNEAYRSSGGEGPEVLVASDRQIGVQDVVVRLQRSQHVVLLIPVKLGPQTVSVTYANALKRFFEMGSSIGAVGGEKNSAYFFFGYQGDKIIHLDPHYVQCALTSPNSNGTLAGTWRSLPVMQCNTSALLGFYVSSCDELDQFRKDIAEINSSLIYPLIEVSSGTCANRSINVDNLDEHNVLSFDEDEFMVIS